MEGIEEIKANLKKTIEKGGDYNAIDSLDKKLKSINKKEAYVNKQKY